MAQQDIQAQIESCNQECQKCRDEYEREMFVFSPSMCRYCENGQRLHDLCVKASDAERQWDNQDWNSSQLKKYYHG